MTDARLSLSNACREDIAAIEIDAAVDACALHLCIPRRVAVELQLDECGEREVLIDGRKELVPYVGPVIVTLGGRRCCTGALVLGERTTLGLIPLDALEMSAFS